MANKPKRKRYGEFRIWAKYLGRGKYKVNPSFVPSVAAWLLMHGAVYQRAIDGMRAKLAERTIPGLAEACETLETCQQHLQRLMDSLAVPFDVTDWAGAVKVIQELMHIEPDSTPWEDVPEGTFQHAISEAPDDGTDASGSGRNIPVRAAPSAHEPEPSPERAADERPTRRRRKDAIRGQRGVQPTGPQGGSEPRGARE